MIEISYRHVCSIAAMQAPLLNLYLVECIDKCKSIQKLLNLFREDIKKKPADLVKIASFTLPPSPPNERVKNKRMKYLYV